MEFFNAYFVHRLFAEHLMRFSVNELLLKDWVKQANVGKLFKELEKLHYILECNLKDLAIMVSEAIYPAMHNLVVHISKFLRIPNLFFFFIHISNHIFFHSSILMAHVILVKETVQEQLKSRIILFKL